MRVLVALTGEYLKQAKERGANCAVTPCPLCFTMLDGYQNKAARRLKTVLDLPVFHLPQLLGLAMGMDGTELMFGRHMVSPRRIHRGSPPPSSRSRPARMGRLRDWIATQSGTTRR